MSTSVLVTGGAGFLGSNLCERLVDRGYEVICLDNFGSGQSGRVSHLRERDNFELLIQNIRKPIGLPPVDQIYHLASRASPKDFTEFPVRIALTNTTGTQNVLEHAVGCQARVVYTSTSEVYGDPEVHPQPETYSGNVNIRGPRGCYDESKRFGETLTVAYGRKYDLDVRTARIFNTYGPGMRPDDGRVIPNFLTQAIRDRPLTVYGDGSQSRCFCYVDDMIDGLVRLMETEGLEGEVVNLGSDDEISIRELADVVLDVCETDSDITHEELPEDDPSRRKPDLAKTARLLDWRADTPLEEGLRETEASFENVLD